MSYKPEILTNNPNQQSHVEVDLFKTILSTHDRLYSPDLRTELSQKLWDEIPALLEDTSKDLQNRAGSDELSVFMHGSVALGVAGEGVLEDKHTWNVPPSDLDLLVVTGTQEEDTDTSWLSVDFTKANNIQERLGVHADITVINFPDMISEIEAFDSVLATGAWPEGAHETLVNAGLLLASPSMYETIDGNSTHIRNKLLKTILGLSHSKRVWQEVRQLFHKLTVDYENGEWYRQATDKERRLKRVDTAFNEILARRGIQPELHSDAKQFMRAQRVNINLPSYQEINTLRKDLET